LSPREDTQFLTGLIRLAKAVLTEAAKDLASEYIDDAATGAYPTSREKAHAKTWLASTSRSHLFDFGNICRQLDFDPDLMRLNIMASYQPGRPLDGSGRATEQTRLSAAVRKVVHVNPGATALDVAAVIQHNYRNPQDAGRKIRFLCRQGLVDGVELRKEGRQARLYPVEVAP